MVEAIGKQTLLSGTEQRTHEQLGKAVEETVYYTLHTHAHAHPAVVKYIYMKLEHTNTN